MTWRWLPPVHSPVTVRSLAAGLGGLLSAERAERELAARLAQYFGAGDVLLTGSGTGALTLALAVAAEERPGPALLPAYACFDLATAALGAGVEATLYDVEPGTLAPAASSLKEAMAGASSVVGVHLFGIPVDLAPMVALARSAGALVIDDAAQGIGGTMHGRPLGAAGDLGVLSFGRGKGVTGGSGGALLAFSAAGERVLRVARGRLAKAAGGVAPLGKLAVQWALARPATYSIPARLPLGLGETVFKPPVPPAHIAAGAAAAALAVWDDAVAQAAGRRANAAALLADAAPSMTITPAADSVPGYLRLPLLPARRSESRELGILAGYPRSLADLPGFAVKNAGGAYPGARDLAARLVTLPSHAQLSAGDLRRLSLWVKSHR